MEWRQHVREFLRHYFRPWFVRVLYGAAALFALVTTWAGICVTFVTHRGDAFVIPSSLWPWLLAALFALVSVAICEHGIHARQRAQARYGARTFKLRKDLAVLSEALKSERERYWACARSHELLRKSIDHPRARTGLIHQPSPPAPPSSSGPSQPQEPAQE